MKQLTKSALCALVLGISVDAYAQDKAGSINYSDGEANKTMNTQSTQFTPTHPAICAEKKAQPPVSVEAPAAVVVATAQTDADKDGVVDSKDKCPDTPHAYKVDPTGCPVSVTLHLHFAFNSSVIPPSDYPEVEKLAKIMKENPPAIAIIVGHTDHVGSDAYNQKLSERRSKALGDKLTASGIEAKRIVTSGKGEKAPIATNGTPEGRAQNRRIEVELQ